MQNSVDEEPTLTATVSRLPDHLKQFVVNQNYDAYTSVDHALWRFIMRQNIYFLKKYAHQIYFDGLLNTGISLDRIPHIEEMNKILTRIGWGAVAVDGFIPPAAFMEFQAYRVLVIAADMRQIDHVDYTPAPDIVHEAAGHAPIIVDQEYADYLQRFGEIGAKAMSSRQDFELYEAIRHLSILKEAPDVATEEISKAEKLVETRQKNLGQPSEMALLSRLHWWTVEYGLIGSLDAPKIYGAGLLSSIGEAASCLGSDVKKIKYNLDTQEQAFDITTMQPQLFVTPDFKHLKKVLEQFAAEMAFTQGGVKGLNKAVECASPATVVYSSGLQVTGIIGEVIKDKNDTPVYIRSISPSALAVDHKELSGHSKEYHKDGFGSPIGKFKDCPRRPESLDDSALAMLGAKVGGNSKLEFESGIIVEGTLKKIVRHNSNIILMIFDNCNVTHGDKVLFEPSWGTYDMAVGESITSVFNGAADKDAYEQVSLVPRERTIKVKYNKETKRLHTLYQTIRNVRDNSTDMAQLNDVWHELQNDFSSDWLLAMEMYELLDERHDNDDLKTELHNYLLQKAKSSDNLKTLIEWGFRLIGKPQPI